MLIKVLVGLAILIGVSSWFIWMAKSEENDAIVYANVEQIQTLLSQEVDQLREKIAVEPLELSLPTDGKGLRILARVEKGMADLVPNEIKATLESIELVVKIEAEESYEPYEAQ